VTRLHERRWTHDRSGWAMKITGRHGIVLGTQWAQDGAWHDEPDKVHWLHEETDLDCLAVRSHFGVWCGYVGLPPGHPLHGTGYDKAHQAADLDAHGGLTHAGSCDEDAEEGHGICHVPLPGRPADVWWLGFDCGHYLDFAPRLTVPLDEEGQRGAWRHGEREQYRTLAYVQDVCERLAHQLARVAGGQP
jgi:hypothetical protein